MTCSLRAGNAHQAGAGTLDDARLATHIVGALILRIAAGPRTQS